MLTHVHKVIHLVVNTFEQGLKRWRGVGSLSIASEGKFWRSRVSTSRTLSSCRGVQRSKAQVAVCVGASDALTLMLGILNIITKSRLSSLNLVTMPKMSNLSLTPLKPSCHPQHDIRDAVLKYAIALLNK